jgi:hypothetical protein
MTALEPRLLYCFLGLGSGYVVAFVSAALEYRMSCASVSRLPNDVPGFPNLERAELVPLNREL